MGMYLNFEQNQTGAQVEIAETLELPKCMFCYSIVRYISGMFRKRALALG